MVDETEGDKVVGRVSAWVSGVGHGVGIAGSALGTEDFDHETFFVKGEVRVGEFGPPETYGLLGGGGDTVVGNDDGNSFRLRRIDWVWV